MVTKKEYKMEFGNTEVKFYYTSKTEKAAAMGGLGALIGGLLGAGVAVWGGYEIGTAVNDYLGLTGTAGRGVVDLAAIVASGSITVPMGFFLGTGLGVIVGAKTYREPPTRK